jgi:phage terminase small subunit
MSGNVLTARERAFVSAWIVHRNTAKAAASLGMTDRQGRRYMSRPAVREAILEAQDDLVRQATQAALDAAEMALQVLRDIAASDSIPASARVAAAKAILDTATKLHEVANLTERVRVLEQKVLGVLDNEN